jgi:hypothetical protein
MAAVTKIMTGTGIPRKSPLPIQRNVSLEMEMGLACVITSVRPRQRYIVLNVMINGGMLSREITLPLTTPTKAPTKILARIARRTDPWFSTI